MNDTTRTRNDNMGPYRGQAENGDDDPEPREQAEATGTGEERMKWISTTIKRKWMDKILKEDKAIERKVANPYWTKRLEKFVDGSFEGDIGINFLCGQKSYKYKVLRVYKCFWKDGYDIDGVITQEWYNIHVGRRIFLQCKLGRDVAWDQGCPCCTPDNDCTSEEKCRW